MAHLCKSKQRGKSHCVIHGLGLQSIRHYFAQLILEEYTKKELRNYHEQADASMLDEDRSVPLDDFKGHLI